MKQIQHVDIQRLARAQSISQYKRTPGKVANWLVPGAATIFLLTFSVYFIVSVALKLIETA